MVDGSIIIAGMVRTPSLYECLPFKDFEIHNPNILDKLPNISVEKFISC